MFNCLSLKGPSLNISYIKRRLTAWSKNVKVQNGISQPVIREQNINFFNFFKHSDSAIHSLVTR